MAPWGVLCWGYIRPSYADNCISDLNLALIKETSMAFEINMTYDDMITVCVIFSYIAVLIGGRIALHYENNNKGYIDMGDIILYGAAILFAPLTIVAIVLCGILFGVFYLLTLGLNIK